MFESLDEASVRSVRRWEAPRIGRVAPPLSVTVPASPVRTPRAALPGERSGGHIEGRAFERHGTSDDPGRTSPTRAVPLAGGTDIDGARSAARAKLTPGAPASSDRAGTDDPPDEAILRERFEAGRRQGLADAEAISRERSVGEAALLLGSLVRERDSRDTVLEEELLALARAMAKLIVRRELEHDVGMMQGVVREALQRLPCLADAPLVRLHPLDAEAVRARMDERDGVTIVADEMLARGDCRIESGATLIDAGIDARMERIGVRHGLLEPLERLSSDTGSEAEAGAGAGAGANADVDTVQDASTESARE